MASGNTLISIIVPTYNYAAYLDAAINSVITQADDSVELIIVDDGSTDDTAAILQPYIDAGKVRYLHQENQGVSAARNTGASRASGEYLLFLDADDRLAEGAIPAIRDFIAQHPDADCILAGYASVKKDGSRRINMPGPCSDLPEVNFRNYLRKKLLNKTGAALFKRTIFDNIRFPEQVMNNEDVAFLAQVLSRYRAASLQDVVVVIYRHADSLRHNTTNLEISVSLLPDIIFNPAVLPASSMSYKSEFTARLYLSRFRSFYLARQYQKARNFYHQAVRLMPALIFSSYTKKYLLSFVQGLRGNGL